MRTRDKVAICRRFKAGESIGLLGLEFWQVGRLNGSIAEAGMSVEDIIREAMNGAPWWTPTKKGGKK